MKIAILHNRVPPDAAPDERDVLDQVEAVRTALAALGHQVSILDCDHDLVSLVRALRADRPERVFNLVESLLGTARLLSVVPSVLDQLRIPYTGCSAEALFVTTSKLLSKERLATAALPTPDWRTLRGGSPFSPGRWLLKSVWEHASIGLDDSALVQVEEVAALERLLQARHGGLGGECFAERYIEGREINMGVIEGPAGAHAPTVLPPAEIEFRDWDTRKPRIVGYDAKWTPASFEYQHTVRSFDVKDAASPLFAELASLTRAAWDLFQLRGYARVDFRIDEAGRPYILEINANPCLTPDAGFAAGLTQAGIGFDDAIARIVAAPSH